MCKNDMKEDRPKKTPSGSSSNCSGLDPLTNHPSISNVRSINNQVELPPYQKKRTHTHTHTNKLIKFQQQKTELAVQVPLGARFFSFTWGDDLMAAAVNLDDKGARASGTASPVFPVDAAFRSLDPAAASVIGIGSGCEESSVFCSNSQTELWEFCCDNCESCFFYRFFLGVGGCGCVDQRRSWGGENEFVGWLLYQLKIKVRSSRNSFIHVHDGKNGSDVNRTMWEMNEQRWGASSTPFQKSRGGNPSTKITTTHINKQLWDSSDLNHV